MAGPSHPVALMASSETGEVWLGCAYAVPAEGDPYPTELPERLMDARICNGWRLGPCCRAEDVTCHQDRVTEDSERAATVIAAALARAEGRVWDAAVLMEQLAQSAARRLLTAAGPSGTVG